MYNHNSLSIKFKKILKCINTIIFIISTLKNWHQNQIKPENKIDKQTTQFINKIAYKNNLFYFPIYQQLSIGVTKWSKTEKIAGNHWRF